MFSRMDLEIRLPEDLMRSFRMVCVGFIVGALSVPSVAFALLAWTRHAGAECSTDSGLVGVYHDSGRLQTSGNSTVEAFCAFDESDQAPHAHISSIQMTGYDGSTIGGVYGSTRLNDPLSSSSYVYSITLSSSSTVGVFQANLYLPPELANPAYANWICGAMVLFDPFSDMYQYSWLDSYLINYAP